MKLTPEQEALNELKRIERLEQREWIYEKWIAKGKKKRKTGRQIAEETGIPYYTVQRTISYFLKFETNKNEQNAD